MTDAFVSEVSTSKVVLGVGIPFYEYVCLDVYVFEMPGQPCGSKQRVSL